MNKEKLIEILNSSDFDCLIRRLDHHIGTNAQTITIRIEPKTYKTEDGYEVKEGDLIYAVCENTNIIDHTDYMPEFRYKQFYKHENAVNYLIENAEVLSYKELEKFINDNLFIIKIYEKERLKQKIRQKLGL